MKLNFKNRTIELTKAEARRAAKIGTEEYTQILEAKNSFPNFQIKIMPARKSSYDLKGLTYEFMERYISINGTEEKLKEFNKMRDYNDEIGRADPYGKIKQWFLDNFPQIKAASASKKNKGVA